MLWCFGSWFGFDSHYRTAVTTVAGETLKPHLTCAVVPRAPCLGLDRCPISELYSGGSAKTRDDVSARAAKKGCWVRRRVLLLSPRPDLFAAMRARPIFLVLLVS